MGKKNFSYEIQYTKAADKFFAIHEDVRSEYEDAVKELLSGDHPERVDVKRIKGKRNDYYRIRRENHCYKYPSRRLPWGYL